MSDISLLDLEQVFNLPKAHDQQKIYLEAHPFPHIVIDNFFQPDVAQQIAESLVEDKDNFKTVFTDEYQSGKTISAGDNIPQVFKQVSTHFSKPKMLRYLAQLTGDKYIIPDPYYNDSYAFYHIINKNGVLGSHVDHSHHPTLDVPHTFNISVYMTPNWKEEYGGELCLFNETGKEVVKKVVPKFNRAIIFACTPTAFHGVNKLADGAPRRHSIYFAYYSVKAIAGKASISLPGESTSAGLDNNSVKYGTYFVLPFKDLIKPINRIHLKVFLSTLLKSLIPPLFLTLLRRKKSTHAINH